MSEDETRKLQYMVKELLVVIKKHQMITHTEIEKLRAELKQLRKAIEEKTGSVVDQIVEEKIKKVQLSLMNDFYLWHKSIQQEADPSHVARQINELKERIYRLEENLVHTPRTEKLEKQMEISIACHQKSRQALKSVSEVVGRLAIN